MNLDRETIDASYRYCRRMSRQAGSSFHAGFLLLPAEKRRAMWALYAFMRHTDDLADGPSYRRPLNEDGPTDDRSPRDALAAWREALERELSGVGERGEGREERSEGRREKRDSSSIIHHSSLLPALADAVRRFQIPAEHLHAVIDGVEMDLDCRRYETFDDLRQYCERVASAVGMACIHIWGFRGPEAFGPARAAGIALQMTNILRDLKEDAAAGRIYLPLADLRECGYSVDDLLAGVINEPFLRLMRLEIERAKQHYHAARGLMERLYPDGRRIYGTMFSTYRELLRRIERRPADVFRRRVRVGAAAKLMILARWTLFPSQTKNPL